MQITRHNYETLFLLYVDNELSATERKAVDVFVQENADLKMELQALQQTIVKADDIVLDKKDWLYMEEGITALQENLLLYADVELAAVERKSVEALLADDKAALVEWNILQQTKLQPDEAVVFPDKQSLYRREGGRVVGFKWWRAAAAAVLLGFVIWTGVSVYKNNSTVPAGDKGLVNNSKTKTSEPKTVEPVNTIKPKTEPVEVTIAENNVATVEQRNEPTPKTALTKQPAAITGKQNNNSSPKENNALQRSSNKQQDNNLPKPHFENFNNKAGNEAVAQNVLPENVNNSKVSGNNAAITRTNPKESSNNGIVTNLKENKTEPTLTAVQVVNKNPAGAGDNSRYLNVDDDKEKRTALGGFLRKAKRIIERTTNIKTGEGIKVAGIEIALK